MVVTETPQRKRRDKSDPIVELRCPKCQRFLGEVESYARVPCRDCGIFITYEPRKAKESSS